MMTIVHYSVMSIVINIDRWDHEHHKTEMNGSCHIDDSIGLIRMIDSFRGKLTAITLKIIGLSTHEPLTCSITHTHSVTHSITHTHSVTHSLTHTQSHILTQSLTHSHILTQSLTHSHILTQSHTHRVCIPLSLQRSQGSLYLAHYCGHHISVWSGHCTCSRIILREWICLRAGGRRGRGNGRSSSRIRELLVVL